MKQVRITFLIAVLLLIGNSKIICQTSVIGSVAETHIADIPNEKDFDKFLKRDLVTYFKKLTGRTVSVEYKLLRNAPTQSGVALPKYYAWVSFKSKNFIEQGAVRLAAIEKKQFEITDYLKKADIERDLEQIYKVFPKSVCDTIKMIITK